MNDPLYWYIAERPFQYSLPASQPPMEDAELEAWGKELLDRQESLWRELHEVTDDSHRKRIQEDLEQVRLGMDERCNAKPFYDAMPLLIADVGNKLLLPRLFAKELNAAQGDPVVHHRKRHGPLDSIAFAKANFMTVAQVRARIMDRPIFPKVWRTCPPQVFQHVEQLVRQGRIGKTILMPKRPSWWGGDPPGLSFKGAPSNRLEELLSPYDWLDLWFWCDNEKIWGKQIRSPAVSASQTRVSGNS